MLESASEGEEKHKANCSSFALTKLRVSEICEMSLLVVVGKRLRLCAFGIAIEVLRIAQIFNFGNPGRWDASLVHHAPVDATEPFVSLYVIGAIALIPETHAPVGTEKRLDQVARFGVHVRWKLVVAVHDFLVDAEWVVIVEGWVAGKHFEDEHAEGPPVDIFVVPFRLNDFRCKVLWRPTESHGFFGDNLSKTEVSDFDVTLFVDKQVFRFKVTIGHFHAVKVLERHCNFCCKKKGHVVGKSALAPQKSKQLAAARVVEHHVDVTRRLEGPLQVNDKRVVNGREDLLLALDMVDLFQLDHCGLL